LVHTYNNVQNYFHSKKSLKIPKGQSQAVDRKTDNTMAKSQKDRAT